MALSRRFLLKGFGVALITAPAVVRYASLMPVRGIIMPIEPVYPFPKMSLPGRYKLVGKIAVPVDDLFEWAISGFGGDRGVAKDQVGDASISTVFLAIDHSFGRTEPPVLFETMVFGGKQDGDMRRYTSYEDAERGHKETLAEVRRSQFGIVRNDDS